MMLKPARKQRRLRCRRCARLATGEQGTDPDHVAEQEDRQQQDHDEEENGSRDGIVRRDRFVIRFVHESKPLKS
jgi:hypothetical protein